jgi:hypothetical protein
MNKRPQPPIVLLVYANDRMAEQFTDIRDPELIEHSVGTLLAQRVMGLALGYEDLNDHDRLRCDALLALACGQRDPSGQDRRHERDKGKALASSSTLNRLELTLAQVAEDERCKKIAADTEGLDALSATSRLQAQRQYLRTEETARGSRAISRPARAS